MTEKRTGLVLSGGGARGAYEAGGLGYLFEHVYPRLGAGFEFDIISGTSVGAVHAAFTAATSDQEQAVRAQLLSSTWSEMQMSDVLNVSLRDLLAMPLRALGFGRNRRKNRRDSSLGGLVDVRPFQQLLKTRVPWGALRGNLETRNNALCVSCTEIRSGRVTVFMDGPLADPTPWSHDPTAHAISGPISSQQVRASAAIPFLFPAARIDGLYYVDGGLRANTPLSPALRLRAQRVLMVTLKHEPLTGEKAPTLSEGAIDQPAFVLGKVLDALSLDRLEYELQHVELINAMIESGEEAFGEAFLPEVNQGVREQRGVGFRRVETAVVRPSQDIGRIASDCLRRSGARRSLGPLAALAARLSTSGVPDDEADLLSYVYFDRYFTAQLVELGRADASAQQDQILELLAD